MVQRPAWQITQNALRRHNTIPWFPACDCISRRNLAQTETRHSPPGDHPWYHDSLPTVARENQPTIREKTSYKCKLGGVSLRSCHLRRGRRTLTPQPQGFNETAVKKKWEKNGAKNRHVFFFILPFKEWRGGGSRKRIYSRGCRKLLWGGGGGGGGGVQEG